MAAKRPQILAQGFNPGLAVPKLCALKGRAREGNRTLLGCIRNQPLDLESCPFRAHHLKTSHPGLKPWAKICNRFAVNTHG